MTRPTIEKYKNPNAIKTNTEGNFRDQKLRSENMAEIPLYNHMEKADFYTLNSRPQMGSAYDNMFRNGRMKFSAKIRKKKLRCVFLVTTLFHASK